MPKYEIYYEQKVQYEKTYEAEHKGEAWKQFYDDLYSGRLTEIDSDEVYSHIEEISEDA